MVSPAAIGNWRHGLWCTAVVYSGASDTREAAMANPMSTRATKEKDTRRTSVSLPADLHQELEQIAKQNKVSFAWVMRDAAELYVKTKWPLLSPKG